MKKSSLSLLSLSMCLLLTACTRTTNNENNSTPLSPSTPVEIKVRDSLNHEIIVSHPIEKIITTDSTGTDICLALGLKDALVGIESVNDDECFYQMIDPNICKLERVALKEGVDVEKINSLNSELVLLPSYMVDQKQYIEDEDTKIFVYEIENFDHLISVIKSVAELTDKQDQAQSLLTYYSMQEERIGKFEKTNEKVYFPSPDHYLSCSTKDMFITKMIVQAGGIPITLESKVNDYQQLTNEQLIEFNPQYIMIPADAVYSKDDILQNPILQNIDAIKNKKIFEMPDVFEKWQEPVPSSILGMMWMSAILHSEPYPFEDLQKEVVLFYQTFYGFTPNKSDITY